MSRDVRLMLVTDAVGGVWTYSLELARAIRKWNIEPILAVIGPSPSGDQRGEAASFRLIDTGLEMDWTAPRPDGVRRTGAALAEIAASERADLVQLNSAALLADSEFDQPVVVVQHSCVATWWKAVRKGPLPRDFAWRGDLIECGLHCADAVVAPSAAFAAQLARTYGLSRAVRCAHNGRTALVIKKRPVEDFVFTVGRLWDDGKNVRTLDAAASKLKVRVEAGGPLAGPNGSLVRFDHLETPGALSGEQIAGRLAARPIFASSALYEPFGLSVLEAAQAGCALVLSDIPTFRELWSGAALFAPADDPEAFANSIQKLLDYPDRRAELGVAARVQALNYTPEAMASRMAQIYADLVADHEPETATQRSAFPQLAGAA